MSHIRIIITVAADRCTHTTFRARRVTHSLSHDDSEKPTIARGSQNARVQNNQLKLFLQEVTSQEQAP
jgi:hypothetical protein